MKPYIQLIIFLTFFNTSLFSQQFKISGKVVGENGIITELVEVSILSKDFIKLQQTPLSKEGIFFIEVSEGNYILQLEYLNDVIYSKNISVKNGLNLGDIKVNNAQELKEVVVQERKKLIERKVDRIVFNVENSISATGGDALDALRVTPSLIVKDHKISIIGKGEMSIMIDDRQIPLSDDDLITFLKTIKSENIKSIEVIKNPPAKYEAQGNSGIINIKLKRTKKNTISGNIKNAYTQAKYSLGSWGGSLNYQKDNLTVSSNINYNNGSIAPYQEYTIYYPNYTWFEINKKRNYQNSFSGIVNIDYKINSKTNIGLQYSGIYSKPFNRGENTSYIRNNTDVLDSLIITPSRLEVERKINSLNFYSITKIDSMGSQYSINLDYFNSKSDFNNKFSSNTYSPNYMPISQRYISANNLSNQYINIYSARVDYILALKWFNFSFGGKLSFIDNDSKVFYFNTTYENPILDPSKSNVYNYKENIQALYVSGNKKLSEKWEMQLGIRLESTQNKSNSKTLSQIYKDNYTKFFPTFYLTYKATENSTFGLNYDRRITRPSYRNLNSFKFYSSPYNYSSGNPFLQPSYTNDIEISFTNKNYFSSLGINYLTNGFDQVTLVSEDNPVQKVIPYNFYKQISIGMTHNYTFTILRFLESNNMVNINYRKTSSNLADAKINDSNKITLYFMSTNSFFLNNKKTLKGELNFHYLSPSIEGSYKTTSWYYVDAGVRYSLLNKKLQINLNVMDVFRTFKTTYTQVINDIKQNNYDYRDSQKMALTLIWSFGKSLKADKMKKSNEEEKTRI